VERATACVCSLFVSLTASQCWLLLPAAAGCGAL
jgi:hypothetical protein